MVQISYLPWPPIQKKINFLPAALVDEVIFKCFWGVIFCADQILKNCPSVEIITEWLNELTLKHKTNSKSKNDWSEKEIIKHTSLEVGDLKGSVGISQNRRIHSREGGQNV